MQKKSQPAIQPETFLREREREKKPQNKSNENALLLFRFFFRSSWFRVPVEKTHLKSNAATNREYWNKNMDDYKQEGKRGQSERAVDGK